MGMAAGIGFREDGRKGVQVCLSLKLSAMDSILKTQQSTFRSLVERPSYQRYWSLQSFECIRGHGRSHSSHFSSICFQQSNGIIGWIYHRPIHEIPRSKSIDPPKLTPPRGMLQILTTLQWSRIEVQAFYGNLRGEIMNPDLHAYFKQCVSFPP